LRVSMVVPPMDRGRAAHTVTSTFIDLPLLPLTH